MAFLNPRGVGAREQVSDRRGPPEFVAQEIPTTFSKKTKSNRQRRPAGRRLRSRFALGIAAGRFLLGPDLPLVHRVERRAGAFS